MYPVLLPKYFLTLATSIGGEDAKLSELSSTLFNTKSWKFEVSDLILGLF